MPAGPDPSAAGGGTRQSAPLAPAIELRNVTKVYGRGNRASPAVRDLSLLVPRGHVVGLLGPNGAGKSTTIEMICGLARPTQGSVRILGMDYFGGDRTAILSRLGVVHQKTALDVELTVEAGLRYHAGLHGIPFRERPGRIAAVLEMVELTARRKSRAGELSGGMQRRVAIATALLHDPDVLILDEPTAALGPENRKAVWAYVRRLRGDGKSILLTTHLIEEAQELCDLVAILKDGELIARDTPGQLRASHGGHQVTLVVTAPAGDMDAAVADVKDRGDVLDVSYVRVHPGEAGPAFTYQMAVHTRGSDEETTGGIITAVCRHGIELKRVDRTVPSLEEVFLNLTGDNLDR